MHNIFSICLHSWKGYFWAEINPQLYYQKDSKIFYFIKEFTKIQFLPTELHYNSTKAVASFYKAKLINQYFYSIFTQSKLCLPNMSNLPISDNHLDSIHKMQWMSYVTSILIRLVALTKSLQLLYRTVLIPLFYPFTICSLSVLQYATLALYQPNERCTKSLLYTYLENKPP